MTITKDADTARVHRHCYRAAWEAAIDLIAKRMNWKAEAWKTSNRVMAALNRTPGDLVKAKTQLPNGRVVSIFRLPE